MVWNSHFLFAFFFFFFIRKIKVFRTLINNIRYIIISTSLNEKPPYEKYTEYET